MPIVVYTLELIGAQQKAPWLAGAYVNYGLEPQIKLQHVRRY